MHTVIHVSGVRKTYGSTVAVDEVSFDVKDGEIFGLIGPNGAGKTTTMECIEGLRTPNRGRISVLGLDPFRDVYKLQERVGVQLQEAQLQKRIKVWEAVDLWVSLYRKRSSDGARLLNQLGLADKRNAWFMLMVLAGKRYYPIGVHVPLFRFTVALLIATWSILSMGFLIASIIPTARFAQPISGAILYPMLGISGVFVPIASMPSALHAVAKVVPLTYAVSLLEGIWKGDAWSAHIGDLAALALVFALCTAISAKVFRWE